MSFGHATEFISFLAPPGAGLDAYDHTAPHDKQPPSIPATFTEAMDVREQVFVTEQGCSLQNEVDPDDARSFHWVVYASVGTTSSPSPPINSTPDADSRRASESTASRVPVGTIRLVPPPHPSHVSAPASPDPTSTDRSDSKTRPTFREPNEHYIKLGRLATISPYRGLGLSKLLYNAAITWASQHPEEIIPRMSPAELEAHKLEGKTEPRGWEGLVLVHAQSKVRGLWEKFGFRVDEGMATWWEEGIEHCGLWKRIPVRGVEGRSLEGAWE